jgi:hypothetical protein
MENIKVNPSIRLEGQSKTMKVASIPAKIRTGYSSLPCLRINSAAPDLRAVGRRTDNLYVRWTIYYVFEREKEV